MENDLFETIRQHYNGIDLDRLYKWCEVAYQKAAHDEGIDLRFGLFIELTEKQIKDDKITPDMLANKIKYNNGYLQAVAMIYGEIAEKEEQIAADLETLSKCRDKTPDLEKLERVLKRLHLRCNEYHEKAEFMPQYAVKRPTIPTATDTAAAQTPPKILENQEIADLFERLAAAGYCSKDGALYRWSKEKALWAYMVDEASDAKRLRPSNDRIPWSLFAQAFTNVDNAFVDYAKVTVSKYTGKGDKLSYNDMPKGWQEMQEIILS